MGTPRAAIPALLALASSRHELVAACCRPDRPAHRGHRLTAPPVTEAALELGLRVLQPETTKSEAFRDEVASLRPDAFAVVAYGHILGPKLLALAPKGAFNLHFSLLPRWRGAAPVQRALLAGDAVTGVSIIRIVAALDAGPVLARLPCDVLERERSPQLEGRLAEAGAPLLTMVLDDVEAGTAGEQEQDEALVTLAPPLRKEEGRLDPRRPAAELERRMRALDPWPGARLLLPRGAVGVVDAEALEEEHAAAPGTILAPRGESLPMCCGEGVLLIHRVKPEGKAEMSARSLVNGRLVGLGDVALAPGDIA